MNLSKSYFRIYFSILFLFISFQSVLAGTFNSNIAVGNWSAAGSWVLVGGADPDGIPDANDDVTILNGHQIRVDANCASNNLTLNNGSTLNFNTAAVTLAVGGNLTFNGTGTTTNGAAGRVMNVTGNLIVAVGATSTLVGIDFTVNGTSAINGSFTVSATTGVKSFVGDMTIGAAGSFNCSAAETISLSGNLIMAAGSTITGTATGIYNINGNLTVNAGGTSTIGRGDFTITGTTTINGTLALSNVTGIKTFTGNVTCNNGSSISFGVSETMDLTNDITFNGTVSISGATTGLINVGGIFSVALAATLNIGDVTLTVTGASNINGTLAFTNNQGGKTFNGLITVSGTGNWNCSAVDEIFTILGGITNNGTFQASLTNGASSDYTFTATCNLIGTFTIPNITVTGAAVIVTNNGTVTVTTALAGSGTWNQANGSVLNIQAPSVTAGLTATTASNLVNYNLAGIQTVLSTSYYNLSISNSGTKTLANTTTVSNDLTIQNTAVLDAGTNRTLNVGRNWTVTSTAADPFVENQGLVTLNGTGIQAVTTVLAGGETFYKLTLNNSSVATSGITTDKNINISNTYIHTLGNLDLLGNSLLITGSAGVTTQTFTAGTIITTVAGAAVTITDPSTNVRVNFYGTDFGDATRGITVTCTSNDSYFTNTILYGTANFTKTGSGTNDTDGGNIFYGPVSFTTTASADRWRMANVSPDIFYNATFTHNGASNFIVSRQTLGNEYYGTTTFISSTSGGMYVSRGNTTSDASSIFHGPVIANITLTGNMTFAEGGGQNNTCTFESTITLNSSASSTGDINFGGSNAKSSIVLTNGNFAGGSILGQTNLRLYNTVQTGNVNQTINTTGSTGILYVGGTTALTSAQPCSFQGNCTFSADTAGYISSGIFTRNLTFSVTNGNGYLQTCSIGGNLSLSAATLRYRNSTITGTSVLTQTGSTNSTSNGGNTFGGNTTINVSGTGQLRCASSASDDYNGNATFVQTNTGTLSPVYSNDATFAGNISTVGSTAVITFGTTGTNTPITDGTGTQTIDGPAGFIPVFNYLRTNHTGIVQLNKNFNVRQTLTMTQGVIDLNSTTLTMGTGATAGTAGTLSWAGGWMYGGTFTRWQYANNYAIANQRGLFPMGTSTVDFRPLWVAYTANLTSGGTVSVVHTPVYPSTYIAASHNDLSWGFTLQGVSNSSWTVSTANGFAFNGATGHIRFGGTGFGTNVLTDLDASLTASVVATHSGATNANTVLEVNRIAVSTANLNNLWRIGTRDVNQSSLPIELISFNGVQAEKNVRLFWRTLTETNNDFFTVERSSDNINISEIGTINGAGNSNTEQEYNLLDEHPLQGTSFYRLKQTDFNGDVSYSNWISVDFKTDYILSIYPNPSSNGYINLNLPESNQDIFIDITDLTGKSILSKIIHQNENHENTITINYGWIPSGIYLLNLRYGEDSHTRKLIID